MKFLWFFVFLTLVLEPENAANGPLKGLGQGFQQGAAKNAKKKSPPPVKTAPVLPGILKKAAPGIQKGAKATANNAMTQPKAPPQPMNIAANGINAGMK